MKKPRPGRKKLAGPPSFDDVRDEIMRLIGNRYAPPADDVIRDQLYQPMLKWSPALIAYLKEREKLLFLDQALRPLRQFRADLAKTLEAAEAEAARVEQPTFRETSLVLSARTDKKQFDDLIATVTQRRQIAGVDGWTWLWEVLPAAIERMMRTTNPQYPRSGKRTGGQTEREPSMTARIMAAVIPLFTGEQNLSAFAIEKELQRLAKLKAATLDLHDQGKTVQQIADALSIDFDEAHRVLVRAGRL